MTTATIQKTDHAIHRQVIEELNWDTRVDETEIGVEVHDGIVTLTGTVHSYAKKMAAQEAAHRVNGVLDVVNEVKVAPYAASGTTDEAIAKSARFALEWNTLVPSDHIQTTVSNGWITLTGATPTAADRRTAEDAVKNLRGVVGVINQITIETPVVTEPFLKTAIESALERRADREAQRIHVELNDGTVELSGRVHNWQEKMAVLGAVEFAPGVRKVEDHLRIDPYF
jgi:osmotically-inducible protein OsmY